MKITDKLKEEHRKIRLTLNILEVICNKIAKVEKINQDHLDQLMRFMKNYYDKCHHKKEEGVIFPATAREHIPGMDELVKTLLSDHYILHNTLRDVDEAIKKQMQVSEQVRYYILLLRQHADLEGNKLCPLLDQYLTLKIQHRI